MPNRHKRRSIRVVRNLSSAIIVSVVACSSDLAVRPIAPGDEPSQTHFIGICCDETRPLPSLPLTGSISTYRLVGTSCEKTSVFTDPNSVYVDASTGHRLRDGWYYARVTDASGRVLLGWNLPGPHDEDRVLPVAGGRAMLGCAPVQDLVHTSLEDSYGHRGFLPSANGVYRIWLSQTPTFDPSASLTATFQVR